jgi:hypothetical protein
MLDDTVLPWTGAGSGFAEFADIACLCRLDVPRYLASTLPCDHPCRLPPAAEIRQSCLTAKLDPKPALRVCRGEVSQSSALCEKLTFGSAVICSSETVSTSSAFDGLRERFDQSANDSTNRPFTFDSAKRAATNLCEADA